MATKTVSLVLAVVLGLTIAGSAVYYVLAVLPRHQAAERDYNKHLEQGREALELDNNGSRAVSELKEATKLFPDRVEPYLLMSRAYFKLQRFQEAIQTVDAVPTNAQSTEDEARLALERGRSFVARFVDTQNRKDLIEAKTSLEKASSFDGTKAEALFNLGTMYASRKTTTDRDKALEYWADALKLDQESETAKQIKPAYEYFLKAKSEGPKAEGTKVDPPSGDGK
jgi:tetratricopeptide (TPR) repeat protein